ncbi:PH domain-containing protein [Streptomyces sp. NPDC008313]|uniref:PH domain-containing protein n=1 Tax=Streptomyces sp. NPDC008313 TaxID=3364826 RepID=UPI0036E74252
MNDAREVTCRPPLKAPLWSLAASGAAGAAVAVAGVVRGAGMPGVWLGAGLLSALVGVLSLDAAVAAVDADARGLRVRRLWRRRTVPWHDVTGLGVRLVHAHLSRAPASRRVSVLLRDGHRLTLPLPVGRPPRDTDFDRTLDGLRELHSRFVERVPDHLPVVSYRTAGHGWAGAVIWCVLLLASSGVAASFVPDAASDERAWKSAAPCAVAGGGPQPGGECLATRSAVIARTEANRPKKFSWLYFTDGRPLERLAVDRDAALEFQPGDRVELTVWRGEVRKVAGAGHVWRRHRAGAGDVAALAAALALAAGFPAAQVLLRLRGRRLPDDEVLPSVLPFAGVLVATALWLLPLRYLHPTSLTGSPGTVVWLTAGSLVTLGLLAAAWHATRVRTPTGSEATEGTAEAGTDVFVTARFLEHTDYNPHGFGTHVVLGGGPPAVTPHAGPGRFAQKRIPVERLTVTHVRRARGDDGDSVPRSWHIAELDDAGEPVRLAAAPDDLTRVIGALRLAQPATRPPDPGP